MKQKQKTFLSKIVKIFIAILIALFCSLMGYFFTLHNSQYVKASELNPIVNSINAINIHFLYIRKSLDEIKDDVKTLKENQ